MPYRYIINKEHLNKIKSIIKRDYVKNKIKKWVCTSDKIIVETEGLIYDLLGLEEVKVVDNKTNKIIEVEKIPADYYVIKLKFYKELNFSECCHCECIHVPSGIITVNSIIKIRRANNNGKFKPAYVIIGSSDNIGPIISAETYSDKIKEYNYTNTFYCISDGLYCSGLYIKVGLDTQHNTQDKRTYPATFDIQLTLACLSGEAIMDVIK